MIQESITNEWAEFLAYTKAPTYAVKNKKDSGFLGRFTMDMLMENYGFARILTVIAREYLFHNMDGTPKGGDPYERTDDARRALCACAVFLTKRMPHRGRSGSSKQISASFTMRFPNL